ncbi:hypothetical protein PsorP6_017123 [Peronosclerospora sorghi]|uniref:Uncharacterized protein n=1 Tax=Peronosclerospora sorghi TaxID=230839 RepID=A0ACC0WE93_9STRA|nr:hypothetical protein PsorP6_017123 [Peronosclerospora sorghi]
MGNNLTQARDAHKRKDRRVLEQKVHVARGTGVLALPSLKLKTLPREVFELSTLRALDVTGNKLSDLGTEVSALGNLKTLKVGLNMLETMPDLSTLEALTTLILEGNVLKELPNALPPHLTKLSLKGNQFSAIPCTVLELSCLQELNVSDNFVSTLPTNWENMHALEELNVDKNKLSELPAALAACTKLKVISARYNLIGSSKGPKGQAIAAELLGETSVVQILNLEGNPLTKEELQQMEGFDAFFARRTKLKNKELHGGLHSDMSLCGLE